MEVQWERGRRRHSSQRRSAGDATADFAFFLFLGAGAARASPRDDDFGDSRGRSRIGTRRQTQRSKKEQSRQRNNREAEGGSIVRSSYVVQPGVCQPPGLYPESFVEVIRSAVGIWQSSVVAVASIARPWPTRLSTTCLNKAMGGAGRGDRHRTVRSVKISHVTAFACCAGGGGGEMSTRRGRAGSKHARRSVAEPVQAARIPCPRETIYTFFYLTTVSNPFPMCCRCAAACSDWQESPALLARKQAMACSGARAGRRAAERGGRGLEAAWIARRHEDGGDEGASSCRRRVLPSPTSTRRRGRRRRREEHQKDELTFVVDDAGQCRTVSSCARAPDGPGAAQCR
jgi:hypothetical protein